MLRSVQGNKRCRTIKDPNISDQELLNQCSGTTNRIRLLNLIGEGTFGKVYRAVGKFHGGTEGMREPFRRITGPASTRDRFAVKFIKEMDLKEMEDEIRFSYYMGESGLGPKVYDAFYYKIEHYDNGTRYFTYSQIIIMEYMDSSCADALKSRNLSDEIKHSICIQMCELVFKQMTDFKLVCIDMKPGNFVYKSETNEVKLIDFGADFCTLNLRGKFNAHDLSMIYSILILQIASMVFDIVDYYRFNKKIMTAFYSNKFYPNTLEKQTEIANYLNMKKNNEINHVFTWYVYEREEVIHYEPRYITKLVEDLM